MPQGWYATGPLLMPPRSLLWNKFKLMAGRIPQGGCDDPQQTFD
jgi:hypothetical protein